MLHPAADVDPADHARPAWQRRVQRAPGSGSTVRSATVRDRRRGRHATRSRRVWDGMTEVDDLSEENAAAPTAARSRSAATRSRPRQRCRREPRSCAALSTSSRWHRSSSRRAQVIGSSPSNFDQLRRDRLRLLDQPARSACRSSTTPGWSARSPASSPETSIVMLVTDPRYTVPVKVIAEVDPTPSTTVPDHRAERAPRRRRDDHHVDDDARRRRPRRRCPTTRRDHDRRDRLDRPGASGRRQHRRRRRRSARPPRRRRSSHRVTRETGVLDGRGADRLPRVELHRRLAVVRRVADRRRRATPPAAATSLAPPDIPIGRVANVIPGVERRGRRARGRAARRSRPPQLRHA